jgi:hypothetical protein
MDSGMYFQTWKKKSESIFGRLEFSFIYHMIIIHSNLYCINTINIEQLLKKI